MLTTPHDEPEMTREEFEMIRDYLHEKAGMYFAENKLYLVKNRLVKRMAELSIKTYRDYFYHVKYDTSMKEFHQLMNVMTTNETSFFRNEPQLLSFSDEVIPLIMAAKEKNKQARKLRVWSAGCSTGEEPYTLAMLMLDRFATKPGWSAEIIANDISEDVLRAARRGEYSGLTLRNVSSSMLDRYYTRAGDSYRVKPEVKALVKFACLNLNDQRMSSMNRDFDVIFCRNVMIYFSDEVKKRIVRGFFNSLNPGGYFYIGHSETLHGISKAFKLVYFKNALVYQKEANGASAVSSGHTASGASVLTRAAAGAPTGASRAIDLLSKIKPMTTKKR